MNPIVIVSVVFLLVTLSIDATSKCNNPKRAVLKLLDCVSKVDANCAAQSYDPSFQRFHNEILTPFIAVNDTAFWTGLFTLYPVFQFDIKFSANVGRNLADIRYIEFFTSTNGSNIGLVDAPLSQYPFNQTIVQHEHVLAYVNNDCKLVKWDQYGDNKEQVDPDAVTNDLIAALTPP